MKTLVSKMEKLGLSGVQAQLMLLIGQKPDVSQDTLASFAELDKSNVARQAANLEKMELLYRQPDPYNRRMLRLHLTDQGQRLLQRIQKLDSNWEHALLQDLSNWEVSQLGAFLKRIRQGVQEAADHTLMR